MIMEDNCSKQQKLEQLKKFLNKYSEATDIQGLISISKTCFIQVIAIFLINYENMWVSFLGWIFNCLNMIRIFIQFHDLGHYALFKNTFLNNLFGTLFGIYVHFPFQAWRVGHNYHHSHFGNLDRIDYSQTIFFTKKQYEKWGKIKKIQVRIIRQPVIFFFVTIPAMWFIGFFLTIGLQFGIWSRSFWQKIGSYIFLLILIPLMGISSFKIFICTYLALLAGSLLFHLQHSVNVPYRQHKKKWSITKAALQGSAFIEIPPLLKTFTCAIQYHHIHHLNPKIPSYNLQQCHQNVQNEFENGWKPFKINQVPLSLSVKSLLNVMLDQQKGIFVPFSYSL